MGSTTDPACSSRGTSSVSRAGTLRCRSVCRAPTTSRASGRVSRIFDRFERRLTTAGRRRMDDGQPCSGRVRRDHGWSLAIVSQLARSAGMH